MVKWFEIRAELHGLLIGKQLITKDKKDKVLMNIYEKAARFFVIEVQKILNLFN